ncbi:MAG TPA: lysylphosphatidylglycerol synthase domain-containing protein [Polyangia bacterium]|jgi:uncharacterized membrane protein YbhN (UPF0104 family)
MVQAIPNAAPAPEPAPAAPCVEAPRLPVPRWTERLFLLVGLGLLGYVVSRYPAADIGRACLRLGPLVALTPLLALAWFGFNTTALYLLLDRRVPWRHLLRVRLIGDGYNALLPLAGFGGEPFKVKHLSPFVPVDEVLTALIRDRVLENAVGMLFTSVWLAVAVGTIVMAASFRAALVTYAALASAVGIAIVLLVLTRLPARVGGRLARWLGAGTQEAVALPPSRLTRVLCCYLAARVTGTLEPAVLLWLLGLGVDPVTTLFCYSLHHAAGTVSFAIPAGLGVFEGTSVYLFSVLGFPGASGVAFALARRGRMLLMGLLGVALHLGQLRARGRSTGPRS